MRYVDLSHTIVDGMTTYQGLPAPIICDYLAREESRALYDGETTFQIGRIDMVGNTGTYIDCPFHRYENGKDFSELFISDLADLPGIRINMPYSRSLAIDIDAFEGQDLEDKAVLIHTGWSEFWRTDHYFTPHPYVTARAASFIREKKVKLVGIDSYNIDDTRQKSRPVHSILLEAGIPIVEHMCQLHLLPARDFYFTACPPRIRGTGSFPVRAFAKF
jgi:arylformamidase